MGNRFASGTRAIAECDRCARRTKLTELRELVVKGVKTNVMVCRSCWDPDHPQLFLGTFPVDDPQGLRNPRPDRSYQISGPAADGYLSGGSRIFSWGWAPVGGGNSAISGTPNPLAMEIEVGTVTVVTV